MFSFTFTPPFCSGKQAFANRSQSKNVSILVSKLLYCEVRRYLCVSLALSELTLWWKKGSLRGRSISSILLWSLMSPLKEVFSSITSRFFLLAETENDSVCSSWEHVCCSLSVQFSLGSPSAPSAASCTDVSSSASSWCKTSLWCHYEPGSQLIYGC